MFVILRMNPQAPAYSYLTVFNHPVTYSFTEDGQYYRIITVTLAASDWRHFFCVSPDPLLLPIFSSSILISFSSSLPFIFLLLIIHRLTLTLLFSFLSCGPSHLSHLTVFKLLFISVALTSQQKPVFPTDRPGDFFSSPHSFHFLQ